MIISLLIIHLERNCMELVTLGTIPRPNYCGGKDEINTTTGCWQIVLIEFNLDCWELKMSAPKTNMDNM